MKPPKGKPRELAPEGTHNATVVQAIDLGTQEPNDPKFKPARKIQLAFELVEESTEEGNPVVSYREYTFSSSDRSTLAKDMKAMGIKDPEEFDMNDILGKPCNVTIAHKEKKSGDGSYAAITAITGLPKGQSKVKKHREPLKALFLDESFDEETFKALPEFLQTKIASSPEYAEVMEENMSKNAKKGGNKKETAKPSAPAKKTGNKR